MSQLPVYDAVRADHESVEPELTTHDRCDRCGAQAYIRARLSAGELLFCIHHGRKHLPALRDHAEIHDESARLLKEEQGERA